MAKPGRESGGEVKEKPKAKVRKPQLFHVILYNDDYTTMEFVVWILQTVFHHDETTASRIMLHVHKNGIGVAGIYTHEIAETRAAKVEALARAHEFPLRCSLEEE